MGTGPFSHRKEADDCSPRTIALSNRVVVVETRHTTDIKIPRDSIKNVNPDPKNFRILKYFSYGKKSNRCNVVLVHYPNCTNFEGKKIMLFRNSSRKELFEAAELDPHFCENENVLSPFARFEPTEYGWLAAKELAYRIVDMTEEERKKNNASAT